MKDRLYVIPHTHYDAAVFKTRAEYLDMGLPLILHALQCLRDDPRYRFVLDQVCYIKPFLERYPEQEALFREMVARGQLQIVCGMDSMSDVNIPSGESFVRQVLYGKGYCRDKLGLDVTTGLGPGYLRAPSPDAPVTPPGRVRLLLLFPGRAFGAHAVRVHLEGDRWLARYSPSGCPIATATSLARLTTCPSSPALCASASSQLKPFAATSNVLGLSGVDLGEAEPHVPDLATGVQRGRLAVRDRRGQPRRVPGSVPGRRGPRAAVGGYRQRPQPGIPGVLQQPHRGQAVEPRAGESADDRGKARCPRRLVWGCPPIPPRWSAPGSLCCSASSTTRSAACRWTRSSTTPCAATTMPTGWGMTCSPSGWTNWRPISRRGVRRRTPAPFRSSCGTR